MVLATKLSDSSLDDIGANTRLGDLDPERSLIEELRESISDRFGSSMAGLSPDLLDSIVLIVLEDFAIRNADDSRWKTGGDGIANITTPDPGGRALPFVRIRSPVNR